MLPDRIATHCRNAKPLVSAELCLMIRLVSFTRFALLLLVTIVATSSMAQSQHDSRGQTFWLTFMANLGSQQVPCDLRVYLAADSATSVRIVYFATMDTLHVDLNQPRASVEVNITQAFGIDAELGMGEEFSAKAFQLIVKDSIDITCYGANILPMSADAFLALPDDVLTRSYIVLAYPNAFSNEDGGIYDQPSQFAIVGTEDGTNIDIVPTASINGRGKQPYSISLNRGEVYNAQADTGYYQDVSGTALKATKPIAVFGGNRRASVPLSVGNYRDHLIEQIPPLEVWGKEAIVTPHFPITPQSSHMAVVRVIAAFDNTTWSINGVPQPPMFRAQPVEIPLDSAKIILASGPILVAQFEHSVDLSGAEPLPGDPFMMIIPPTEQFHYSYAFQAIHHPEFKDFGHYINVVIPSEAIMSVMLDDAPIITTWDTVPTTRYSFAQVHLSPGAHRVVADSVFGVYSYGYGPASSYGYAGGSLYRTLVHDFQPPHLDQVVACDSAAGFASDTQITDSGIDSLYQLPSSRNVNVTIEPFTEGADTVRYTGHLVDPYQDGIVSMKTVDGGGRSATRTHEIPGLTVRAAGAIGSQSLLLAPMTLFNGRGACNTIVLENHGKFAQTISRVDIVPSNLRVTTNAPQPIRLEPGEKISVEICATLMSDTLVNASIVLVSDCRTRIAATIPIEAIT
ncbi:MAG: IgGFc-binding protein, partial [bacterium]|nr:IgGFc-binding protein [Candidatus Kapabacteria bacterium]